MIIKVVITTRDTLTIVEVPEFKEIARGTYKRNGDDGSHTFVIVFEQTTTQSTT